MRGLFTKIFLCFWIAQSLTFVISTTLILQHHFARPDQLVDVLKTTFGNEARAAADAYESAGCDGFARYAAGLHQTAYLADSSAHLLCQHGDSSVYNEALSRMAQARLTWTRVGSEFLWSLQIHSASKRQYFFLLSRPFRSNYGWFGNLRFFAFPQLPVAIVVFGLTTFVLVLLLTRPIARLRAAARDLASGKLKTRVAKTRAGRIFGGDEIQGLVHDFNHMAEQLESLVAAQKMLLRDVSHELRSPLARLSVALELAREEAPPRMTSQLQRIERETGRLNQLIGDLLRLSWMESSPALLDRSEFSLNELLEEMLADAEFEAQRRTCKVDLHAGCSCTVRGNPELIYRAIENVIRNAIRYTKDGSVVEVDLSCDAYMGQPTAVLRVSDRGPGIPEDELKNIFQPFYRVDDARQRNTGGFGVGLALTERAVRLHHGEVQAQNRPNGGLTVALRIPCERVQVSHPVSVV
jgi:two-component system, OmpR family, sensor histidine kinase CpxA